MPTKDPVAKGEQAHKQGDRQYVHLLSPTLRAWS